MIPNFHSFITTCLGIFKDTTTVFSSSFVILAPGDVRPGHIMLAPLRMNRIAPLSTCIFGNMKGSGKNQDIIFSIYNFSGYNTYFQHVM